MQFNTIYIEKEVQQHPISREILSRYPEASIIPISDYKQFFNRKNQNFTLQRKDRKLILARQKNHFTFPGTDRVRSFGNQYLYSCSMLRNCYYHCEYCFLSGMHESANIVLYVNLEDFKAEVERLSQEIYLKNPTATIYLITSYLSDLPAFEEVFFLCRRWIEIANELPNVELEIRSKSDAYSVLRKIPASPNAVLVWSISPQEIIRKYEHGTASFHTRILQTKAAIADGWRVRLCFDPVIYSPNWEKEYSSCLRELFTRCSADKIEALSFGVFRMGLGQLKRMRKLRPALSLLHKDIEINEDMGSYNPSIIKEIQEKFIKFASPYFSEEKIFFVHG